MRVEKRKGNHQRLSHKATVFLWEEIWILREWGKIFYAIKW